MSFADITPIFTPPGGGAGGGAGGGTPGAILPFDLVDLQDVVMRGLVGDRDALVFDRASSKWINEAVQARLPYWNSVAQYNVGDLVLHNGAIYRCSVNAAGVEPGSAGHLANWKNLSLAIKEWLPNQEWQLGDIVRVPWSSNYFAGQPVGTAILSAQGYSLWMAEQNIPKDIPVVPGEPDSVSNVPPGQWRGTHYQKQPDGHWDDPGSTVPSQYWECLSMPALHGIDTYQDLLDMVNPAIPGSMALILRGPKAGNVYRYDGRPGGVGDYAHYRGWHPVISDLWPIKGWVTAGTPAAPSGVV